MRSHRPNSHSPRYGGAPGRGSIHASKTMSSPPIAVAGCIPRQVVGQKISSISQKQSATVRPRYTVNHLSVCRKDESSLRQHHSSGERRKLTVSAGEVRLDPSRLRGPDTAESPSTPSR